MKIRQNDPIVQCIVAPKNPDVAKEFERIIRVEHEAFVSALAEGNSLNERGALSVFLGRGSQRGTHDVTFASLDLIVEEAKLQGEEAIPADQDDNDKRLLVEAVKSYELTTHFVLTLLASTRGGGSDTGTYLVRRAVDIGEIPI